MSRSPPNPFEQPYENERAPNIFVQPPPDATTMTPASVSIPTPAHIHESSAGNLHTSVHPPSFSAAKNSSNAAGSHKMLSAQGSGGGESNRAPPPPPLVLPDHINSKAGMATIFTPPSHYTHAGEVMSYDSSPEEHRLHVGASGGEGEGSSREEIRAGLGGSDTALANGGSGASKVRRVQWPAELSKHVSIAMVSPTTQAKTLQDQGAQAALTKALEEHSKNPRHASHFGGHWGNAGANGGGGEKSEGNSTAVSSDGDPEERMQEMRDNMEVFVDPGETDGLPSIRKSKKDSDVKSTEAKSTKAAWSLVRAYTKAGALAGTNPEISGAGSGSATTRQRSSSVRYRKNASGFISGDGNGGPVPLNEKRPAPQSEVNEKAEPKPTSPTSPTSPKGGLRGFFSRLGGHEDLVDNASPSVQPPPPQNAPARGSIPGGAAGTGGGILSALIALQNGQAATTDGTPSGMSSGANTSGTTTPHSIAPSLTNTADSEEDDEEEEAERLKFLIKQREKRAVRNQMGGNPIFGANVMGNLAHGHKNVMGAMEAGAGAIGTALGLHSNSGGHGQHQQQQHHGHSRSKSDSHQPNDKPNTTPNEDSHGHSSASSTGGARSPLRRVSQPPSPTGLTGYGKKKSFASEMGKHIKQIGGQLGLDTSTTASRPDAAKSGAGVFGGLMLSTGNIAGVAAPNAVNLAPNASRPGFHLSRYSAPQVSTIPTIRKSTSQAGSLSNSRPGSVYGDDSPRSRTGTSTANNSPPGSPPVSGSGHQSPAMDKKVVSQGGLKANGNNGSGEKGQGATGAPTRPKPIFSLSFKDVAHHAQAPKLPFGYHSRPPSVHGTDSPRSSNMNLAEYFSLHEKQPMGEEEREAREWEKEKKKRRKAREKRKQQEVFITLHVAAILARQEFIMKMARSFMMFGAPSHRLEAQMQATARVLEINCQVIYIPGVMLVSFGDTATHTSEIKFLKQANGLDLGKLLAAYYVYYNVIHDKISVTEASVELDVLMVAPPRYKLWQHLLIGGLASAVIQPSAFYGSFIDMLASIPLGMLLVLVQVVVSRNDLYSSLFEIVIACINSFLALALASTNQFCFAAVASGSVVLILPGYIVLCGSLELANRSIISGSVRLVYSILYSLFLGFGLSMGSEVYHRITGITPAGVDDFKCALLRTNAPWYRATIPPYFFFLTIPLFLLIIALRNGQPLWRKETPIMILIGAAGFTGNYFSGKAFVNRSDISSAIGSFVVGFLGNVYGKFTKGSPFVVMVVGVLLQLPSGLSNGGLLQFADSQATDSTTAGSTTSNTYSAGFQTAESLVEVAIGLTVGLFLSAAIVNFFGGGRRRGSNLSSF